MKAKENDNADDADNILHLLGAYRSCLFLALLFIFNLIITNAHGV